MDRPMIECPQCNAKVRADRLAAHLSKRCPSAPTKKSRRQKRATKRNRERLATENTNPSGFVDWSDHSLDGSVNYWDAYRENGRFGSHPSHDDYGDEAFP